MNHPRIQFLLINLALAIVLGIGGCSTAEPDEDAVAAAPVEETAADISQVEPSRAESVGVQEELEPDEETPAESVAANFEPPYPQRSNIFEAPQRTGRAMVQNTGEDRSAIELLGFVNVDGPRVVLSIDGLVASIAEGDQQEDIQVISIHPPAVVLQRGRQRWQASLDN